MKLSRSILVANLIFSLVFVSFLSLAIQSVSAQDSRMALQRGYRAGYSDGYMFGYRDIIDNAAKSYNRHSDYTKANRAYNKDYGSLEDYSDGYRQGFEIGYDTGFGKRAFDATIPTDLSKRGAVSNTTAVITPIETKVEEQPPVAETTTAVTETVTPQIKVEEQKVEEPIADNPIIETTTGTAKQKPIVPTKYENVSSERRNDSFITIPVDTELIVELVGGINTELSKEGDKFQARVISPYEFSGAIIEGRISKIQKPGRIKRRSEVLLSFDRIVLTDNRWGNFNALLTEVLPIKGDNISRVDVEGVIEGKGSIKADTIKVAATTGTGLVVGAVTGGPVGAAVGAGVGAAFGVGVVVVERGKHIRLNKDQQLRIRSAYETQIR